MLSHDVFLCWTKIFDERVWVWIVAWRVVAIRNKKTHSWVTGEERKCVDICRCGNCFFLNSMKIVLHTVKWREVCYRWIYVSYVRFEMVIHGVEVCSRCDGYYIFVPRLHYPGRSGRITDCSTVPTKLYIFSVSSYILMIALKAHITSQV